MNRNISSRNTTFFMFLKLQKIFSCDSIIGRIEKVRWLDMHTEVFDNIDTLIKMADSPLNIDEINTELITINRSIKNKKNEIEDFKSLITESRYFNASNELVYMMILKL